MTLPGPDIVYECHYCKNKMKNKSLVSGNSIGLVQYSDSKQILPMLPEYPNLTKCEKSDSIFF